MGQCGLVVYLEFFPYHRGIPLYDYTVGDVLCHNHPERDNSVVADRYTGVENRLPTDPDVITDRNGFCRTLGL